MREAINDLSQYEKYSFDPNKEDVSFLSNSGGIYMICAKNPNVSQAFSDVKLPIIDELPVLYIGNSSKQGFKKRDYGNHFKGTARNSTLRKSLGSIFGWKAERVYYEDGKYKFNKEREKELSQWMKENLSIVYWIVTNADIDSLETRLINELSPPLNIAKNHSSMNEGFRKKLKELRD